MSSKKWSKQNPYQESWELQHEKVARLNRARIIATSENERFGLDKQIEDEEKQLADLETQMDKWDKRQQPPPMEAAEPPEANQPLTTQPDEQTEKSDLLKTKIFGYSPSLVGAGIIVGLLGIVIVVALLSQSMTNQEPTPTQQVAVATPNQGITPTPSLVPTATENITLPLASATPTPTTTATTRPPTPTATVTARPPTPTPGIGSTRVSRIDGMVQVYVPAGSFTMGSISINLLAEPNEVPRHTVTLDAYWIDQTEVTNEMYALCVADGACNLPVDKSSITRIRYYGNATYANYPVIYINWNDANNYCRWRGHSLPTEAQWEKAARGGDGRSYPWGNENPTCNLLNYDNCVGDTTEVGSYPAGASPYSVLDMAGNVSEWVGDWYDENYYDISPSTNPIGPLLGNFRILRGGSWFDTSKDIRLTARANVDPDDRVGIFGFRCVAK